MNRKINKKIIPENNKLLNLFLISTFLLILFSSLANAAANLQVTQFSCSPNEVKVNSPFSCTATVRNSGDSAGTLNTATLFPDATNWLEDSSYAVTANTNINSGATAEVTFSNLKAKKSGNNGFARIMLDSVTDTFVADNAVKVNAINIISIANSNAATAPASSSSATVTGQATAGGNVDVTLSFSVSSGGCSIGSQSSSTTTNDLTEGQTASRTWTITMGTTACSYVVTAEATSNPSGTASKSDSSSGSITCSSGCSSSGSSGGGGGGGGGGASAGGGGGGGTATPGKVKRVFSDVKSGDQAILKIFKDDIPVKKIAIAVNKDQKEFTITVESMDAKPETITSSLSGKVYKYLEISKENLNADEISSSVIEFQVPESWLSENKLMKEDLRLFRWTGQWTELPTTFKEAVNSSLKFEAITPGFSTFAIGSVSKAPEVVVEQPVVQEQGTTVELLETASEEASQEVQKETSANLTETNKYDLNTILGVALGLLLLVLVYLIYTKFMKREKSQHHEKSEHASEQHASEHTHVVHTAHTLKSAHFENNHGDNSQELKTQKKETAQETIKELKEEQKKDLIQESKQESKESKPIFSSISNLFSNVKTAEHVLTEHNNSLKEQKKQKRKEKRAANALRKGLSQKSASKTLRTSQNKKQVVKSKTVESAKKGKNK